MMTDEYEALICAYDFGKKIKKTFFPINYSAFAEQSVHINFLNGLIQKIN